MIKIPNETKQFSQVNKTDLLGNIFKTKNISFDKKGYITLSPRTEMLFSSQTATDLTTNAGDGIQAIVQYMNDGEYWFLGTDTLYYMNDDYTLKPTLTKDATASTPSFTFAEEGDMISFVDTTPVNYLIVVTGGSVFYRFNGTTWTSTSTGTGNMHVLCEFVNRRAFAVGGQTNEVYLYDASFALINTLVLPDYYYVTSMAWVNDRLFIGTLNYTGVDTLVFEWDGASSEATVSHKMYCNQVFALAPYKDGVVAVTSDGKLKYIAGSVTELASFPIVDKEQWMVKGNVTGSDRRVLKRGLVVDGDRIYIGVDARYSTNNSVQVDRPDMDIDFLSGVWCYDPEVGLYHKYSIDGSLMLSSNTVATTGVDTTTNIVTVAGVTVPPTGTPVFYDNSAGGSSGTTPITPLSTNTRYFTIKLSDTTFKLATTYANALAGTAIDLTGTGNNAQFFTFHPVAGFGGGRVRPRAMTLYRSGGSYGSLSAKYVGELLIGSVVTPTTVGTEYSGIHSIQKYNENRGYFITPKIQSADVLDTWQKIYVKHSKLVNPEDKIIIKYRTEDNSRIYRNIYSSSSIYPKTSAGTWVDSTSFTCPYLYDTAVGDEIEIVTGAGSGYTAHISAISGTEGNYTVTIDETVQGISADQTFWFLTENWTKLSTQSTAGTTLFEVALGKKAQWIQIKVELRGIGVRVEGLQIINETFKPSV